MFQKDKFALFLSFPYFHLSVKWPKLDKELQVGLPYFTQYKGY